MLQFDCDFEDDKKVLVLFWISNKLTYQIYVVLMLYCITADTDTSFL